MPILKTVFIKPLNSECFVYLSKRFFAAFAKS